MKSVFKHIYQHPGVLLYMVGAWVVFAILTTTLSIYPLLSDYALRTPQVFTHWETWNSFLVYTYNWLPGGIINTLNTLLFGFWVMCFVIYNRTYIQQGVSIATSLKLHGSGTWGSLAAILGGGCIGCGFTFLTNLFGATLGALLTSLPFRGAEISSIGTIIILISIIRIARQIDEFKPEVVPDSPSASQTLSERVY